MLRKAFSKPPQVRSNSNFSAESRQSKVLTKKAKKRLKNKEDKELENVVLGNTDSLINDLNEAEPAHIAKKKRSRITDEKPAAWVDSSEEPVKTSQLTQAPKWASLDSEIEERDSHVDSLLTQTGQFIERSTTLQAGLLQIEKLGNANATDIGGGKLQNVEFHPSAKVILTAGTSHRLNLFQVDGRSNPKIQSVYFDDYPIHTAHFSRNGDEIVVGSDRRNFLYYDMIAGRIVNVPKIRALEGSKMARFEVSPDGKYIVFLGQYGAIHVISATSKEWISTLKMNGDVYSLSFSSDGSRMYSYGDTGMVFVWDMNTRMCIHTFVDEGCVHGKSIAVSPNNNFVACGSQSGIVNVYSTEVCLQHPNPKPLRSITNLTTICNATKFNCSSEILAISSSESLKAVKLVHFPSLHVFANFPSLTDKSIQIPKCLDFSPNSGYLAIGNHKGHALLYRLKHYADF